MNDEYVTYYTALIAVFREYCLTLGKYELGPLFRELDPYPI